MWIRDNWQILLVVVIPAVVGLVSLVIYRRSKNSNLLAAVVGFTSLATAALAGALWAARVPQYLFRDGRPFASTDDAWKATQSVTLTFGAIGLVAASVITYHRQRSQQDQVEAAQKQVTAAQDQLAQDRERLDHVRQNDQDRLEEDRRKHQLELDKFAQEKNRYEADQARETQRRRQERYADGAKMLADKSPAVRIAGLNVIAALGQEVAADDELRQTCVNLLCAYLRSASLPDDQVRNEADQVVEAEAARLLPLLLETVPSGPHASPPHGLTVDLRSTTIPSIDLSRRVIGFGGFGGARFTDVASFSGALFTGDAWFDDSEFLQTGYFLGAAFTGKALFSRSKFEGHANFSGAEFQRTVSFRQSTFGEEASFHQAQFSGDTSFRHATFEHGAYFRGAAFQAISSFRFSQFRGTASFIQSTFSANAWFENAGFSGDTSFSEADFLETVSFRGSSFRPTSLGDLLSFRRANFHGPTLFDRATISGDALLEGAHFAGTASFSDTKFQKYSGPHDPNLAGALFDTYVDEPYSGAVYGPPDEGEDLSVRLPEDVLDEDSGGSATEEDRDGHADGKL